MKGNPEAATFVHNQIERIAAYVRGDDGHLHVCYYDPSPQVSDWVWDDQRQPLLARVNSSPTAVAARHSVGGTPHPESDYLYVFLRGNDGHLYEHVWKGFYWAGWEDRGLPVWNATMVLSPGATAFRYRSESEPYISGDLALPYVFVWGATGSLHGYWAGQWRPQGRPFPDVEVASVPAAIHDNRVIYAYIVGNDGNLYARHSTGHNAEGAWHWRHLGQPNANTSLTRIWQPGLVAFTHDRERRIYAFTAGSDYNLWVHYWKGSADPGQGTWVNLSERSTNGVVEVISATQVVTFDQDGEKQIYAFVRDRDENLQMCFYNARISDWVWINLGKPPSPAGTSVASAPGVVTHWHDGKERIYAFVRGVLGREDGLYVCVIWYASPQDLHWKWAPLGAP